MRTFHNFKLLLHKLKSKGQTAVEYILLFSVVVSIVVSILQQVKGYILDNAENCTPASTSIICKLSRAYDIGKWQGGYVYYTLRR